MIGSPVDVSIAAAAALAIVFTTLKKRPPRGWKFETNEKFKRTFDPLKTEKPDLFIPKDKSTF